MHYVIAGAVVFFSSVLFLAYKSLTEK
jgi:hypothetical protein